MPNTRDGASRPPTYIPSTVATTNSTGRELDKRQSERRLVLRKACFDLKMQATLPEDDEPLAELARNTRIFFSDRHKVIACEIPKSGCTNIKRILLMAEGITQKGVKVSGDEVHELANSHLLLSTVQNASEIRRKLNSYYKFIMVREPLQRLLSAYRDKLEHPKNAYFSKLSRKMHERYTNESEANRNNASVATFPEFLRYVSEPRSFRDAHWEYYHTLCSPCNVGYDFIAHMETIDEDTEHFMKAVNMTDSSFPEGYSASKRTDKEKMIRYTEGSSELVTAAYMKYLKDYQLFGYAPPEL